MNYYETIKQEFISNEIYKRVKDYSKNQNDLKTYYNVGKMLCEAGKHYGEGIIREYSKKSLKGRERNEKRFLDLKYQVQNMKDYAAEILESNGKIEEITKLINEL